MLVLARRERQRVLIAGGITVEVLEIDGNKVRLGFTAPPGVAVDREEVAIRKAQEAASNDAADGP